MGFANFSIHQFSYFFLKKIKKLPVSILTEYWVNAARIVGIIATLLRAFFEFFDSYWVEVLGHSFFHRILLDDFLLHRHGFDQFALVVLELGQFFAFHPHQKFQQIRIEIFF
jgi:hypothetical protein